MADALPAPQIESALHDLLKRGGTIGGTSAGAAIMSKVMITSGTDQPEMSVGWDLLPDAIIDQDVAERNRLPRTRLAVDSCRDKFGLAIESSTAVSTRAQITAYNYWKQIL
ncbi:MAG TPA: Type 1 glutamine amidotransferase-like domain-containing protein, partial [Planctomycetaceae bacterium]|nr:Type 1 glutamine amidotransferase-like domain-containing protein [Planctomycetaceae bacterium]